MTPFLIPAAPEKCPSVLLGALSTEKQRRRLRLTWPMVTAVFIAHATPEDLTSLQSAVRNF